MALPPDSSPMRREPTCLMEVISQARKRTSQKNPFPQEASDLTFARLFLWT
jgi:hypothetical protein